MFFAGPLYAAAALLVAAGAQKVADPQPLVRAFRSLRVSVPPVLVRALALTEVLVGTTALVTGNAVGVAVSYAAFTVFILVARARGGVLASCGCFGKRDVPPTRTHAGVTAGFAAAALTGAPGALPLELPLLVTTAAVAVTAYLVMAVLPVLTTR